MALRANAIVAAMVVFLFGSAPDALATLRATLLGVVAPGHGWSARIELAAVCLALARSAVPRITLGATGWMRSLAIPMTATRRAAIVALCTTQAFAIVVVCGACIMAITVYRAPLSAQRIAAIPVMIVAAGAVVLPVRGVFGRMFALAALIFAIPGTWPLTVLGIAALAVSDRLSGSITNTRRTSHNTGAEKLSLTIGRRAWLGQWMWISVRALPFASVAGSVALPVVFVAFAYFIVRHNPDLSTDMATRTVRICGSLAAMAMTAALANTMLRARPAWRWSRSMPWSSTDRVAADALMLGIPLVAIPIALAPLAPVHALAVAGTLPPIAAAAAAALRNGSSRQAGAAGESVIVAIVAGVAIALWPITSLPIVLLTPLMIRLGARRERRARVSRWVELQHDSAGDPAWLGSL